MAPLQCFGLQLLLDIRQVRGLSLVCMNLFFACFDALIEIFSMNEPHGIPGINLWGGSVHAAVKAIRNTCAISQLILL